MPPYRGNRHGRILRVSFNGPERAARNRPALGSAVSGRLNRNGIVVYRGPSAIDGAPIAAVLTGLKRPSANVKTGRMLQLWILPLVSDPLASLRSGADASVCGMCPMRPHFRCAKCDRRKPLTSRRRRRCCGRYMRRVRPCYVDVSKAPQGIAKCLARGGYREVLELRAIAEVTAGSKVRLGAWGDPAALPYAVLVALVSRAIGHTGYTHRPLTSADTLTAATLCMVSADTLTGAEAAWERGLRTFRVGRPGERPVPGRETLCPAVRPGSSVTCETCLRCDGATRPGRSVFVLGHGAGAGSILPAAMLDAA